MCEGLRARWRPGEGCQGSLTLHECRGHAAEPDREEATTAGKSRYAGLEFVSRQQRGCISSSILLEKDMDIYLMQLQEAEVLASAWALAHLSSHCSSISASIGGRLP